MNPTSRSRGVSAEDREILLDRNREMRDMGALGAGSAGAYLVPQGFVRQVDVALKFAGDMLQAGTTMQTDNGQPLPWPNENDSSISGEQIAENTQVTTQDVTLGSITFNAWKYSTKLVKVSLELLQDSAFDMESFLAKAFGTRLGRILNNKFTVGVGHNRAQRHHYRRDPWHDGDRRRDEHRRVRLRHEHDRLDGSDRARALRRSSLPARGKLHDERYRAKTDQGSSGQVRPSALEAGNRTLRIPTPSTAIRIF